MDKFLNECAAESAALDAGQSEGCRSH